MTLFTWTPEQIADLVPGAKVVVTFPDLPAWEPALYTVRRVYGEHVIFEENSIGAIVHENTARNAVHRLDHCDPSTVEAPRLPVRPSLSERDLILARSLAAELDLIAARAAADVEFGDSWCRDYAGEAREVRRELYSLLEYTPPEPKPENNTDELPFS